MSYRLRNCCLQGLKIRSMETKRFRLRLLISQARLGEKPLETEGELSWVQAALPMCCPLPGSTSLLSLVPVPGI